MRRLSTTAVALATLATTLLVLGSLAGSNAGAAPGPSAPRARAAVPTQTTAKKLAKVDIIKVSGLLDPVLADFVGSSVH